MKHSQMKNYFEFKNREYKQVSTYTKVMFLKNGAQMEVMQIEHKIPI